MKTSNKITRLIATTAVMMLMLACGSSTPQNVAVNQDSVLVQKADSTNLPAPMPATPAKFDGYALYKATFEALRDKHIMLTDATVRAKWVSE